MSLQFDGSTIPGIDAQFVVLERPVPQIHRRFFWGLHGESEIFGGNAGQFIRCDFYMMGFDPDTVSEPNDAQLKLTALDVNLTLWDTFVGGFGELKQTITQGQQQDTFTYTDCRYLGFERLALAGQPSPKPVEGHCPGMLGYVQFGRLNFYRLS